MHDLVVLVQLVSGSADRQAPALPECQDFAHVCLFSALLYTRIVGDEHETTQWIQKGDIIIPVLGLTGAGKSMFINTAIGQPTTHTSEGILSCTQEINKFEVESFPSPHRIFLVDTPGFNHTYLDESEIFHKIAHWLKDVQIAGIIFLHDMSQSDYLSLNNAILTLQRLSGYHSLRNVVLATVNWGNSDRSVVGEYQRLLARTEWGNLISRGARDAHFVGTQTSAWKIIESIARKPLEQPLRIQREMGSPWLHPSAMCLPVGREQERARHRGLLCGLVHIGFQKLRRLNYRDYTA